jgi:hypothetical protein
VGVDKEAVQLAGHASAQERVAVAPVLGVQHGGSVDERAQCRQVGRAQKDLVSQLGG